MSDDQHYRLADHWASDEWPAILDEDALQTLNEVAPLGYHYSMEFSQGEVYVELWEYIGEDA